MTDATAPLARGTAELASAAAAARDASAPAFAVEEPPRRETRRLPAAHEASFEPVRPAHDVLAPDHNRLINASCGGSSADPSPGTIVTCRRSPRAPAAGTGIRRVHVTGAVHCDEPDFPMVDRAARDAYNGENAPRSATCSNRSVSSLLRAGRPVRTTDSERRPQFASRRESERRGGLHTVRHNRRRVCNEERDADQRAPAGREPHRNP